MSMHKSLTPRLVVAGADAAIEFYENVFDARLLERFADPDTNHVVHAVLGIGDAVIALTEERQTWNNVAPTSLDGSPVIINLVVDDADAVGQRLVDAGAETIFEISDQFYGHREGRFKDPFGHLWIISTITEALSPDEIEARMRTA